VLKPGGSSWREILRLLSEAGSCNISFVVHAKCPSRCVKLGGKLLASSSVIGKGWMLVEDLQKMKVKSEGGRHFKASTFRFWNEEAAKWVNDARLRRLCQ
jgi:hypothetical protein